MWLACCHLLSLFPLLGGTLSGHLRDLNWYARRDAGDPFGVGYYEYAVNANGLGLTGVGGADDTDVFGRFEMTGLEPGTYTVASWDVWWRSAYAFGVEVPASGSAPEVDLRLRATMWGYPAFWDETGYHEFGQTFEATGPVSMIYLRAAFGTDYRLTVHANGPGGVQVGVARSFGGAGDHRLIYGYGDMPTVAGQTYYVRIRTSDPSVGGVLRQMDPRPDDSDPMPGGCLWLGDGQGLEAYPRRDLGLIIMSDDDGLLTNLYARRGGGTWDGATRAGQTFVARGVGLISAAFWLADASDPVYEVRVHEGGVDGPLVGTPKRGRPARRSADPEMVVTWSPGECPLVSGQTYHVEVRRQDGDVFNSVYVNTSNPYPFGTACRNGVVVAGSDLAGTLMEEAEEGSAARRRIGILNGPEIQEAARQADRFTVRWITDIASDSRVEFALEQPPYTHTVTNLALTTLHSITVTGLQAHAAYHLRVRSAADGFREAVSRDVTLTTRPSGANLLRNPGFEEGSGASPRDVVPGWIKGAGLDIKASDGTWFSGVPPHAGQWLLQGAINGGSPAGWIAQRVEGTTAGERYTFSAWITTWMRENGQFKYDVWNDPGRLSYLQLGIDPLGGTDPDAASVRWTPRLYSHLHYSNPALSAEAEADAITVFVLFGGAGGEWHLYGVDDCVLTGDDSPPNPRRAEAPSQQAVRVRFSKATDPASAGLAANYTMRPLDGGDPVAVLTAQSEDERTVLLTTGVQVDAVDYGLSVSNVLRPGAVAEEAFLNGEVPVLVPVPLFSFDGLWRYESSGADPGADWSQPGYDDSLWPEGRGLLGEESSPLPEPIRTPLSVASNKLAFYFRKTLPATLAGPSTLLRWRQIVDDGVVLYLNGEEVARTGMGPGPVNHQTPASRVVGDAALEGPMEVEVANWLDGGNLLAAEVHQQGPTSSDVVFGLAMEALVRPSQTRIVRPVLTIRREGSRAIIAWDETGWTLEYALTPAGPWYSLSGMASPYGFTPIFPASFFRLRR